MSARRLSTGRPEDATTTVTTSRGATTAPVGRRSRRTCWSDQVSAVYVSSRSLYNEAKSMFKLFYWIAFKKFLLPYACDWVSISCPVPAVLWKILTCVRTKFGLEYHCRRHRPAFEINFDFCHRSPGRLPGSPEPLLGRLHPDALRWPTLRLHLSRRLATRRREPRTERVHVLQWVL